MMLSVFALLGWMWMAPPCETGFCSCAPPGDVPSSLESAEAVFTGSVVAVRDTIMGSAHGSWTQRVVTLRVDRAWKGVESETVVLMTGWGGGDCGFPFEHGKSYLVYTDGRPGELPRAGICGRTAVLSRANADIRALGEPAWRSPPGSDARVEP